MQVLKISVNEDGSVTQFTPDFKVMRGSYRSVLLNMEVPHSLLLDPVSDTETGESQTGNNVRIGALIRTATGKNLQTKRYEFRKVKDYQREGKWYRLYQRRIPKEFTMWETVNLFEATSSGILEMVINIVNWTKNEGSRKIEEVAASPIFVLDIYPSAFLDNVEEIEEPSNFDELYSQVQELNVDIEALFGTDEDPLGTYLTDRIVAGNKIVIEPNGKLKISVEPFSADEIIVSPIFELNANNVQDALKELSERSDTAMVKSVTGESEELVDNTDPLRPVIRHDETKADKSEIDEKLAQGVTSANQYTDNAISNIELPTHYKAVLDSIEDLPEISEATGDFYIVNDLGDLYDNLSGMAIWNGEAWDIAADRIQTPDNDTIVLNELGRLSINDDKVALKEYVDESIQNAVGESTGGGSSTFDKVIRTQAEFDELINSPTWLDAESVAFVGSFFSYQIIIPQTVKHIEGFGGCFIEVQAGHIADAFGYSSLPTFSGTRNPEFLIKNITIWANARRGFFNCVNLTNCKCITDCWDTNVAAFFNCKWLDNCRGSSIINDDKRHGYGFQNCESLINCDASIPDGAGGSNLYAGFSRCNDLSNCKTGTRNVYSRSFGFQDCKDMSNCKMICNNMNYLNEVGFQRCEDMSNCSVIFSEDGNVNSLTCFIDCKNISNGRFRPRQENGSISISNFYGFQNCENISTILLKDFWTNNSTRGFQNCKNISNVILDTGGSFVIGFEECTNITGVRGSLNGSGYVFERCKYISACSGLDDNNYMLWGDGNEFIDTNSCQM